MNNTTKIEERRSNITELLKHTDILSMNELANKFGVSHECIRKDILHITEEDPNVVYVPRKGCFYKNSKSSDITTNKDLYKNAEGYPDFTAGKAMENYDNKLNKGQIWSFNTANGGEDLIYILIDYGSSVLGFKLQDTPPENSEHYIDCPSPFNDEQNMFLELTRPLFKLKKYANNVVGDGPDISTIHMRLVKAFGIDIEPRIIEKTKEVVKYVEKPVIKEVKATEIEVELLKQKVEIYERLIFGDANFSMSKSLF